MYKGKWLCIVVMLMLTTVGIAQDKDRNPSERQLRRDRIQRAAQNRMAEFVRQVTDPLVQRVSKSVVQLYNLDQTAVSELRQSIQESAEVLLTQPEDLFALITAARKGNYTKMLETLLSHPNCKTAFAKYLNEEQLQEYMDYTLAQEQRGRQAVVHHLTAWLDQHLSLTVGQREKIEQRLIANAGKGRPFSPGDMVLNRRHPVDVVRQRLKPPPADVLSQTQLAIWRELMARPSPRNEWRVEDEEDDDRKEMFDKAQAEIIAAHRAGRIGREEIGPRLKALKLEFWGEGEDDASEFQEKMRQFVEAKLTAHTQQLGPLDESAAQRLVLVTKGVVEEYLETQGENLRAKYEETDITYHPLYQQTIEDVLSEEAFAQYKARQAERQGFRQQALRDVLVVSIDAHLFLSDEQRKHFEMVAEELPALSAPDETPAPVYMVHQLFQRTDHGLLSSWQRKEFERIATEN
ncbi:hypothetical protein C6502_05870 [Candidatus Poribacteria bacterium]|nr:MAG: hypothetical protein C6502_05870 [Candidatus Poribacteria bacterium]